jgi:phosphatidylglycerol---prolipoprotein diacylglyceryl transferase
VHPIAFHIGSFAVYWYGAMTALALLAGLWTAGRRGLRQGVASEMIVDLGPWLVAGGIVGARLVFVVSYWPEYFAGQPVWEIFMIRHGGLVYYGGLIGAALVVILYARIKKLPVWKLVDILTPSVPLGCVFGRIGCLLNGCCYGRACDLPWAIRFPAGHDTHPAGLPATPVHPVQVYDSLLNLGLYLGLAWLYRRKKFDGQVFAAYLMGYAMTRSFVETFRGDYSQAHLHGGLTPAHLISIGMFATGAVLFALRSRLRQKAG